MANLKEIGNDVTLEVGGEEFPVTDASYTEDADIAESQFNTGLHDDIVVTGVSYSGSFEHDGSNEELRSTLYGEAGEPSISVPREVGTITFTDSEKVYTFEGVVMESRDKDFPADDRTSVSYDFIAEKLTIEADGSGDVGISRAE